jgi:hypothetical protein
MKAVVSTRLHCHEIIFTQLTFTEKLPEMKAKKRIELIIPRKTNLAESRSHCQDKRIRDA